jgi:protein gp37
MADNTSIEWTDATWNPVAGCTKVSKGCDNCYAERLTERFHGKGSFGTVTLHPDRLNLPLRWRKPRMVFVNSMSDLFHDHVPDAFIAQAFAVMAIASRHTFQVLTKRPGRMVSLLGRQEFERAVLLAIDRLLADEPRFGSDSLTGSFYRAAYPLRNVWLGTSVENQRWADIRIPKLLETPSVVRFLSCEPLLGPVDLDAANRVDWVIVGGESGPLARPMDAAWARSLRDQCSEAGVPFFFKQWGGPTAKSGGRELDGRTWDELPQAITEVIPALA